jgi:hypothetical protein
MARSCRGSLVDFEQILLKFKIEVQRFRRGEGRVEIKGLLSSGANGGILSLDSLIATRRADSKLNQGPFKSAKKDVLRDGRLAARNSEEKLVYRFIYSHFWPGSKLLVNH